MGKEKSKALELISAASGATGFSYSLRRNNEGNFHTGVSHCAEYFIINNCHGIYSRFFFVYRLSNVATGTSAENNPGRRRKKPIPGLIIKRRGERFRARSRTG